MNSKLSRCSSFMVAFFTVLCTIRNIRAQSNGPIFLYIFGADGIRVGILRIFYNNAWGNICDDGSFGMVEANVACRQAGYAGAFRFSNTGELGFRFGFDTSTPTGMSNVSCSSQYLTLLQCSFSTVIPETCDDSTDIIVFCDGASDRDNGRNNALGISEGNSSNQGLLEIRCQGKWGFVCLEGFGQVEADSACRQLGYSNAFNYTKFIYDPNGNVTWFGNVTCNNVTQPCLTNCQRCPEHAFDCPRNEVVFITCYSPVLYTGTTLDTCNNDSVISSSPAVALVSSTLPPLSPQASTTSYTAVTSSFPSTSKSENLLPIAIAVPLALSVLLFVSLVATIIVLVCVRLKHRKKETVITILEEELRERNLYAEQRNGMPLRNLNRAGSREQTPQIAPETLEQIESALIPGKDIRILDKIGQGEFGVVYKAHLFGYNNNELGGSIDVAVKTVQGSYNEDDLKAFVDETLKMKELSHPNIMNLMGVCIDAGPTPYIVLPYMANGDLLSYIRKQRNSLLVSSGDDIDKITAVRIQLFSMCLQISQGMEYLSSQSIIHRDLAARNCMIDDRGVIKVADFGLSKSTYEKLYFRQDKSENVKLPIKWLAIEGIEYGLFSEKSDIWAFGVTCWEIFSGGKIPYGGLSPLSLPKMLKDGERMEAPDNAACSQEIFKTVMQQCWRADPDKRPTFSQMKAQINAILTTMAGYLDFSDINPCEAVYIEFDSDKQQEDLTSEVAELPEVFNASPAKASVISEIVKRLRSASTSGSTSSYSQMHHDSHT